MTIYKILFILALFFTSPRSAFAQVPSECLSIIPNSFKGVLERAACSGGITTPKATGTRDSLLSIVSQSLTVFYSFVGVIFLVLVIYSGFLWMTARGNADQVERAQGYLRNLIFGIIILFGAFIVTREVVNLLGNIIYTTA